MISPYLQRQSLAGVLWMVTLSCLPAVLLPWVLAEACLASPASIPLNGSWSLALKSREQGASGRGESPPASAKFTRTAQLPGSLAVQEIGDPITLETPWVGRWDVSGYATLAKFAPYRPPHEIKLPFWLTPSTSYVGPAWYRRTISIPHGWSKGRVILHLERCHWFTQVWLDGKFIGKAESLAVPHEFELTADATPGEHELVICVDNTQHIDVGSSSHSVSDQTQGNWNGIIGKVELRTTPTSWIDELRLDCSGPQHLLKATALVDNQTTSPIEGTLTLHARLRGNAGGSAQSVTLQHTAPAKQSDANTRKAVTVELALGPDAALWDEFAPNLYDVEVEWLPRGNPPGSGQRIERSFGIRTISTADRHIFINGQPRFLRGTVDCCVFPLTGHPPVNVKHWKRVFATCRDHGLNHIRFHSYCPPEAAFVAADELGMYLQIECGTWANFGAMLGDGQPIDRFVIEEARRIVKAFGDHPSFIMLASGNESEGKNREAFLTAWVNELRRRDDRRLYTGATGWPALDVNQFQVNANARMHQWGDGLKSRINAKPPETNSDYRSINTDYSVPVISHEIGQWCVFPNFDERHKYTGHLKAKNFDIFADELAAIGQGSQAREFLLASGKLQTLCYKEEIESALRTPGYAGFQLLGLSDFTGQGTALVGMLDPFWEPKPYVSAREIARFCGPVVPLARLKQRTFTTAESLRAELELANFGPRELKPAQLRWKVVVAGTQQVLASGELSSQVARGELREVGPISVPLASAPAPRKLQLIVGLADSDIENDWDLWVYPIEPLAAESDARARNTLVTSRWDDEARQQLANGGQVLLTLPPSSVKTDQVLGFSPLFWNTTWTMGQEPHTLGILCQPKHPLLRNFPTESHCNWQWWELINGAAAMDLTEVCPTVQPLIQVVPDWAHPRLLALAFEAQVDAGNVLVTSANVLSDQQRRPAARQFLASLHAYLASDSFQPQATLSPDQVQMLIK